jgi:hypothetical protein
MADPIVGIVNGIPASGTGNITTLGQTLVDGANITIGATTDLAPVAGGTGSISGKLRAISRDLAGGIVLQTGGNVIGGVTQSGGPWSVSGTLAATQSGSWNITNITGTISLPTGAATAALQPTNAALGSATSGQTGNLAMGATTTAAPSYTTGQSNALSLTTTGALRTDSSATTQPVSGTVSISGTIGATQSGTWTVQPGNTPNTVPWLMTINQGGNAATVSATGALKTDASATTQPVSATALPLPAGAATAALQPTNAAQGSTTSGQTGPLVQGAVATAAPTYANGTTSPVSLTTAGAIRVDGSAVSQPVSGTVTATQGGNWSTRTQDGAGNAITSDARGSARPLAVEILDASGNQITSFGAGSGPSFGSAFPSTGQAVGAKDVGGNMAGLNLNAGGALKVDGSATTQPVSGTFWQATQPVSGTFWQATQPISAAALPLPSGAATSANQATAAGIASTTSGQTGGLAMGAVTTSLPGYTTGQTDPLSLSPSGLLRVDGSNVTQPISGNVGITGTLAVTQSGAWSITNISGTVSLPTGASTAANQPTNAALASTTSGQTGTLGLGAVTTGSPSYTTATSNALSLTTAGALRVDNSGVTQPISGTVTASQGGTWTMQPGNTANTTPWLMTIQQAGNVASVTAASALKVDGSGVTQPISGTVTANQGGNWLARMLGNAGAIMDFPGQNASSPANALMMGGQFNTTPTAITSGNASPLQLDTNGNLLVNIKAGGTGGGAVFGPTPVGSAAANPPILVAGTANATSTGNVQVAKVSATGVLSVDGSSVTQPVSGTFWQTTQPVSAAALPLPTGASTAANQPTNAGQASATSGQTGGLAMGAVTSAAPAYTTAQTNPLSLTTTGNLRVDGSSVTQPVSGTFWQATQPISGTITANQGGAWNITNITGTISLPAGAATSANQPTNAGQGSTTSGQTGHIAMGAVTTGAPSYTTAQTSPLSLDLAGNLRVNVVAGGTGGGAVFGPTAVGSAAANPPVLLGGTATGGATGSVEVAKVSAAGLVSVDGSGVTQPVSGTFWQATQPVSASSLPLPAGASISANQPTNAAQASATSGQTGGLSMGAATTAAPSYTTGQTNPLSLNLAGGLRVDGSGVTQPVSGTFWQATQPISGTITANQGGAWTVAATQSGNWTNRIVGNAGAVMDFAGSNVAAAANSLQTGGVYQSSPPTLTAGNSCPLQLDANGYLRVNIMAGGGGGGGTSSNVGAAMPTAATVAMGSVTTAAPAYTTATANALSLTTVGNLRVDGSGVTQPVSGTFWQATQPVSAAALPLPAGAATAANQTTVVTSGSATSGQNGQLQMGAVTTGAPAYTTGQSDPLSLDTAGNLRVSAAALPLPTGAATAALQLDPATYNAGTAWTSATGVNTTAALANSTLTTWTTIVGQITQTSTITGGQITFEESYDNGATYVTIPPQRFVDPATYAPLANPYVCAATTNQRFHIIPSSTGQIRARLSTVIAGTGSVTVAWTQSPLSAVDLTNSICGGDTAAGTTDGGWPIKIGGLAKTTNPTAVTDGQRVNAMFDKVGKQVVVGAIRQLKGVQATTITVATETTIVTAGAAGVFQDLYGLVIANTSATAVNVAIKDATAGTTRMTIMVPAGDTRGFTVPVDSAVVQATAANNWTATVSSAVSSILVTALYVSNT